MSPTIERYPSDFLTKASDFKNYDTLKKFLWLSDIVTPFRNPHLHRMPFGVSVNSLTSYFCLEAFINQVAMNRHVHTLGSLVYNVYRHIYILQNSVCIALLQLFNFMQYQRLQHIRGTATS